MAPSSSTMDVMTLNSTATVTLTATNIIEPLYTENQMKVMAIVPYISSILSLVGSSVIIYVVLHDKQQRRQRQKVFYRMLLGISIFDFITSLGFLLLGSWTVPRITTELEDEYSSSYNVAAYNERWGTPTTCRIAGTTSVLLNMSIIYNTFLTIYHVLAVVLEYRDDCIIAWKIERIFHTFPVVGSIALLTIVNALDYIQPMYILSGMCGPEPYPPGCTEYSDVECTKGFKINTGYVQGPILLANLLIIVISMSLIYRKVWLTEKKLQQYGVVITRSVARANRNDDDIEDDEDDVGTNTSNGRREMTLTKTIGQRGLWYTGSFLLCYIFYALTYVLPIPATRDYQHVWFPIAALAKFFTPLQGFFHVFIFLAPKYRELSQPGNSLHFVQQATNTVKRRMNHIARSSSISSLRFTSDRQFSNTGSKSPPNSTSGGRNNSSSISSSNIDTSTRSSRGIGGGGGGGGVLPTQPMPSVDESVASGTSSSHSPPNIQDQQQEQQRNPESSSSSSSPPISASKVSSSTSQPQIDNDIENGGRSTDNTRDTSSTRSVVKRIGLEGEIKEF